MILITIYCFLTIGAFSNMTYADRNAMFVFEVEKVDWELESLTELVFIALTNEHLSESYNKFYWVTNTDVTFDSFLSTMVNAAQESTTLDLYTITHGGQMYIMGHYDAKIYSDDILSLSDNGNMGSLRFVYLGSCEAFELTDEFIDIGAVGAIGNPGVNGNGIMYPVFIKNFGIKNGEDGLPLSEALQIAVSESGENFQINGDGEITMMWEPEL